MIKIVRHRFLPIIFSVFSFIFSSCLAVGVPYTSDPDKMLSYSAQLLDQNREFRAKEMLDLAFQKYTERGNRAGLCNTYLFYSNYYRREIYTPIEPSLANLTPEQQQKDRQRNPRNYVKSTHTDYDKAIESLKKAVEVCAESHDPTSVFMANMAIGETIIFDKKGNVSEACKYFETSKRYYLQAKKEGQKIENFEGKDFGPTLDAYMKEFCHS